MNKILSSTTAVALDEIQNGDANSKTRATSNTIFSIVTDVFRMY